MTTVNENPVPAERLRALEHEGRLHCLCSHGPEEGLTAAEIAAYDRGVDRGIAEYDEHCARNPGAQANE